MISKHLTSWFLTACRRVEKLVLPSIFDTSVSSLMMWNLRSYPTTVLSERMLNSRGQTYSDPPTYFRAWRSPGSTPLRVKRQNLYLKTSGRSIMLKSILKARSMMVFEAVHLRTWVMPNTMPPLNAARQFRPPSRFCANMSLSSAESSATGDTPLTLCNKLHKIRALTCTVQRLFNSGSH